MGAAKGNKNAVGNQGGRPTLYNARFVNTARQLACFGATDFQIAEGLDVDVRTVQAWRYKHPEFDAACEPSEEEKLRALKRSLFHRAMGYNYKATKIVTATFEGEILDERHIEYTEHVPPDLTALKYYLNSKSGGEFNDTMQVEQSGGVTIKVVGGLPEQEEDEK